MAPENTTEVDADGVIERLEQTEETIQQQQETITSLREEIAETKARVRKLESGGASAASVTLLDQYDKPVVETMRSKPDSYWDMSGMKSLYRQAGITDTEKVKDRIKSLTKNGIIEKGAVRASPVWTAATDE